MSRWIYLDIARAGYLLIFWYVIVVQPISAAEPYRVALPLVVQAPIPSGLSEQEAQLVALINERRRQHGCTDVRPSSELNAAAKRHSHDMASNDFFSHIGSDGSTFGERAKTAGYPYWPSGEILAAGYTSPSTVVEGWMNSDGHRRIMLTCAHDDIGVSLQTNTTSDYGSYWTAVFGQR